MATCYVPFWSSSSLKESFRTSPTFAGLSTNTGARAHALKCRCRTGKWRWYACAVTSKLEATFFFSLSLIFLSLVPVFSVLIFLIISLVWGVAFMLFFYKWTRGGVLGIFRGCNSFIIWMFDRSFLDGYWLGGRSQFGKIYFDK